MNVGDVYWVDFPARGGHEQAGRRPAIVAQDAAASDLLPTVLVIPLTTRVDALRFPGTLAIDPDTTNGLRRASVALVFQMSVIDRRFVSGNLGRVSDDTMQAVWSAFDSITGRDVESNEEQ
jgi:mRNA-degrading endonuclease toxin of MazEF toxin-antitoxin module